MKITLSDESDGHSVKFWSMSNIGHMNIQKKMHEDDPF